MEIANATKSTVRRAKAEARPARTPGTPVTQRVAAEIQASLDSEWIPRIYRERVLSQRTRPFRLQTAHGNSKTRVSVEHTLLGVELKIGRRRMLCPDLATARYLAVFARAGCIEIAVPYNITKISRLADELETSWERMMLLATERADSMSRMLLSRVRLTLMANLRREIEVAGDGKQVALDVYPLIKSKSQAHSV